MRAVGLYLAGLRQAEGLTQKAAAARVGIASKTVERWEAGSHEPALTALKPYVEALQGSVDHVVNLLLERQPESDPLAEALSEAQATGARPTDPDRFNQFLDLVAGGMSPQEAAKIALHRP